MSQHWRATVENSNPVPLFIQAGTDPIFRVIGGDGENIACAHCGRSVLVENTGPNNFLDIHLECQQCGKVTSSPSRLAGTPIPQRRSLVFQKTRLAKANTTEMERSHCVVSENVIREDRIELGVGQEPPANFNISASRLEAFADELNRCSGGRFNNALKSAERAAGFRARPTASNRLAASLTALKKALSDRVPHINSMDLQEISVARYLMHRWRRHPAFPMLMIGFCNEYDHTVHMLSAASYLADHGNGVGVEELQPGMGRQPDLYVQADADERVYIEVKAPLGLCLDKESISDVALEQLISRAANKSRGQLHRKRRGILVIGARIAKEEMQNAFDAQLRYFLERKGKSHASFAALVGVALSTPEFELHPGHGSISVPYSVFAYLNPYFEGENPIAVV